MHQRYISSKTLQLSNRILTCLCDPVEIEFCRDVAIPARKNSCVAGPGCVLHLKLKCMVVVTKLDAGIPELRTSRCQRCTECTHIFDAVAPIAINPRHCQTGCLKDSAELDRHRDIRQQVRVARVRADHRQTASIKLSLERCRRQVIQTRKLNTRITGLCNRIQCCMQIHRCIVPQCVQLKIDRICHCRYCPQFVKAGARTSMSQVSECSLTISGAKRDFHPLKEAGNHASTTLRYFVK